VREGDNLGDRDTIGGEQHIRARSADPAITVEDRVNDTNFSRSRPAIPAEQEVGWVGGWRGYAVTFRF
jgi:hypothetical protein